MTRVLFLTRGLEAIVDDADHERVADTKWRTHVRGDDRKTRVPYARGMFEGRDQYLHRVITNAPRHLVVHHIDGDGLNCRRENLQLVPAAKNTGLGGNHSVGPSGFRGVHYDKVAMKYRARIKVEGVTRCLGRYDDAIEAAQAWDRAAIEVWGPFVRTNFRHPEQESLLRDANLPPPLVADVPF